MWVFVLANVAQELMLRSALQGFAQLPIDACHCRRLEHDANPATKTDVGTSSSTLHDYVSAMRDHDEYQ